MNEFVQFALLGVGSGAIYALAAQGIVVIYRGSGVLNFSQGALGLLSAAFFVEFWYESGWPLWPTAVLAVLLAGVTGAVVYLLVMRPLQDRSPLVRLVASIGVLTVLQQGIVIVYGSDIVLPPAFLPAGQLRVYADAAIGYDRLVILGVAVVLSGLLAWYFRSTRLGMATQATNDDPIAAAALGWSPVVIGCVNWTIGAALGGLAGVFIVSIAGLAPVALTLVILPAFAAALSSGFRSFGLTLVYGVLLGMGQALLIRYGADTFGSVPGLSADGWADALPFLVIVVVLVCRGSVIPRRGELLALLPRVGFPHLTRLGPAIAVVVLVPTVALASLNLTNAIVGSLLIGIVGLSVVILTGYGGQLSLGQMAIAGIAALVAGRVNQELNLPFLLAALFGIAAAVGAGVLFSLPALRSRGVTLAVVTLGLGVAVEKIIFANVRYTGGISGTKVDPPEVFGWSFQSSLHPERYAYVVIGVFIGASMLVANVRRGKIGRRFIAVRSNENAAASLGISVPTTKVTAFGLAAVIAALGGILMAFRFGYVQYDGFTLFSSLNVVIFTVIGGVGFVTGAALGSILAPGGVGAYIGSTLVGLDNTSSWIVFLSGVLLLVVIIVHPNGQVEILARRFAKLRAWARPKTAALAASSRRTAARITARPSETTPAPGEEIEPARRPDVVLAVKGLSVAFGRVVAVDDVSLSVEPGEIVGLIGANGAGKTTLLEAISGYVRPASGTVTVGDKVLTGASPRRLARSGIRRSFQGVESFDDLSVGENLLVAQESLRARSWPRELLRPTLPKLPPDLVALADRFGLAEDLEKPPDELPLGQRRLLGVARALAGGPSILLLDEPASGLNTEETAELASLIRDVVETIGIGVLLVEHDVDMVIGLCDRVVVLDVGRVIFRGPPSELLADPAVRAAYLGEAEAETSTGDDVPATPSEGSHA
jgi:sulfate-transporting ATPase